MALKKHTLDFTNVKDASGINPKRMPAGDYKAVIINVEETMKEDIPMWNFYIQLDDNRSAVYPYYCKLQENQLWKVRNLLIAAGKSVPKKRVSVDPSKLLKSVIGVTLADDEYEGKLKSVIDAVFPANELAEATTPAGVEDEPDELEASDVPDDDEDDDELDVDEL